MTGKKPRSFNDLEIYSCINFEKHYSMYFKIFGLLVILYNYIVNMYAKDNKMGQRGNTWNEQKILLWNFMKNGH
jgi:hypothetical protein